MESGNDFRRGQDETRDDLIRESVASQRRVDWYAGCSVHAAAMVQSCMANIDPHLLKLTFVRVPSGSFRMGGSDDDKFVTTVELPAHEVNVRAFELAAHPVTRGQWNAATGETVAGNCDLPMTLVSFVEAASFAAKIGARLPTEAECEYACRAGSTTVFPHGSDLAACDANFLYDESGEAIGSGMLLEVGHFAANAFGLHDMLGNVCEWTVDHWHPNYQNAPSDGSAWIDDGKMNRRVIRGGAWDHLPRLLRASWRDWAPETARWDNLGFRLARDISQ